MYTPPKYIPTRPISISIVFIINLHVDDNLSMGNPNTFKIKEQKQKVDRHLTCHMWRESVMFNGVQIYIVSVLREIVKHNLDIW